MVEENGSALQQYFHNLSSRDVHLAREPTVEQLQTKPAISLDPQRSPPLSVGLVTYKGSGRLAKPEFLDADPPRAAEVPG
jgi:hypothetical protein